MPLEIKPLQAIQCYDFLPRALNSGSWGLALALKNQYNLPSLGLAAKRQRNQRTASKLRISCTMDLLTNPVSNLAVIIIVNYVIIKHLSL